MKIPAPGSRERTAVPAGLHRAVCTELIDLGTQSGMFRGVPNERRKLMLRWSLIDSLDGTGNYLTVDRRYTASLAEGSSLYRDLCSWRGTRLTQHDFVEGSFDLERVVGKPCRLQISVIEKNETEYPNVDAVFQGQRDAVPDDLSLRVFSLDPDRFDRRVFASLSEPLRRIIASSPEFKALDKANH